MPPARLRLLDPVLAVVAGYAAGCSTALVRSSPHPLLWVGPGWGRIDGSTSGSVLSSAHASTGQPLRAFTFSSWNSIVDGSVCGLYRPTISMNLPSRGERESATRRGRSGSSSTRTRRSHASCHFTSGSWDASSSWTCAARAEAGCPCQPQGEPANCGILPLLMPFIVFSICLRASSSRLTCCTEVPLPSRCEACVAVDHVRACSARGGVIEMTIASTSSARARRCRRPSAKSRPRDQLQHTLERAHLHGLMRCRRKSSNVNFPLRIPRPPSPAARLPRRPARPSPRREHVAHAEDPRRHPVGVEVLELVELLANGTSLIGRPVTALTESAAPPRASPSSFVARRRRRRRAPGSSARRDGFLAGHRVETSRTCAARRLAHARELVHQLLVDVQAACGVEDDRVAPVGLRAREAVADRGDRVAPLVAVHRHLNLSTELLELLDRSRAAADRPRRAPAACRRSGGAARASRPSSSCPSPAGRRAGSGRLLWRCRRGASRRCPSAPSARRGRS